MDGFSDPMELDGGPFGRPLFDKPSARALARVGVVDVGSNSVRLVVFDGAARSPAYFYNEKIEFCADVLAATGLKLWVIDGREEARLSAQGVLLGWPGAYGLVCDMGGSSMELAEIDAGTVGARVSSPLGPLKLRDIKGGKKARKAHIKDTLTAMQAELGEQRNRLFLVGGSWRAIAKIDMARRNYPLHVLHEYRMTPAAVRETIKYIADHDLDTLRAQSGVSSARISLVPHAAEVLHEILKTFRPRDIAVTSYGIR
jgi:exopolyphosphatase/guanosine-5'-triphosphate,3'-diphosphate pyrophosphatase